MTYDLADDAGICFDDLASCEAACETVGEVGDDNITRLGVRMFLARNDDAARDLRDLSRDSYDHYVLPQYYVLPQHLSAYEREVGDDVGDRYTKWRMMLQEFSCVRQPKTVDTFSYEWLSGAAEGEKYCCRLIAAPGINIPEQE